MLLVRQGDGPIVGPIDIDHGQLQSIVENSLRGMIDTFERQKDAIASSVNGTVAERFSGLATQMQQRMGLLEELVKTAVNRPIGGGGDLNGEYIQDAVGKIINNQHTLASSIDEWRTQYRDDFSAFNTRMERLEARPVVAPVPPLTTDPVAPVDGWTRFKMWLYGTSDWYAESWGAREEDHSWTAPRPTAVDPNVHADPPQYEGRTTYDQRA
jgi:hypothetical protein